jgi:hypothetical protein
VSVTYYQFLKHQRTAAYTLVFNMFLLIAMYYALVKYLPEYASGADITETLELITIAMWPIEITLFCFAVYLWRKNKAFCLSVSPVELYYFDPNFGDQSYRIPVKDILEIDQFTNTQQAGLTNRVMLVNGEHIDLMYHNFWIDRKAFFAALVKANPNIKVPSNPSRYEITKPAWAKKLLGKK